MGLCLLSLTRHMSWCVGSEYSPLYFQGLLLNSVSNLKRCLFRDYCLSPGLSNGIKFEKVS